MIKIGSVHAMLALKYPCGASMQFFCFNTDLKAFFTFVVPSSSQTHEYDYHVN